MAFVLVSTASYNIVKAEQKPDFFIQKKPKRSTTDANSDGHALVSPIKIVKVTNKRHQSPGSQPSSFVAASVDNLLSTKQLEPVQVHSVVSTVGQATKPQPPVVQSVNVKTLLNTSPSSIAKPTQSPSAKPDEIRFVIMPSQSVDTRLPP